MRRASRTAGNNIIFFLYFRRSKDIADRTGWAHLRTGQTAHAGLRGLLDGKGWSLSAGSVLGKLAHVGDTGGGYGPSGEVTPRMVKDLSRILLSLVFLACSALVFVAFRKRERRAS